MIEDTVSFENNCLRNLEDCLGAGPGGEDTRAGGKLILINNEKQYKIEKNIR